MEAGIIPHLTQKALPCPRMLETMAAKIPTPPQISGLIQALEALLLDLCRLRLWLGSDSERLSVSGLLF